MNISIVISTYKRFEEIQNLINSINNNFPDNTYEIIAVSSDDPKSEKIIWLEKQKNCKVHIPETRTSKRNYPLTYFYNIGIKNCNNEYIILLNDDMEFNKSFYDDFIKLINYDYDIICVKTNLGFAEAEPSIPEIGSYITPDLEKRVPLYLFDFIIGKKEFFEKINFLDEKIEWYGIGVDLSLNAVFNKYPLKISYENDLYIKHYVSQNDRDPGDIITSSRNYSIYLESKWRKFCEENPGYDYIVNY